MRVVVKTVDYFLDTLVDERVVGDVFGPLAQLWLGWQLAIKQKISNFEVRALLGQLFNGVSAVLENSFIAVDKSDSAFARSRVHKRRVIGHHTEVVFRHFD